MLKISESSSSEYTKFATNIIYDTFLNLQTKVKGTINIALSGGSTPLPILEQLKEKKLNWKKFNFFIVDERCVSTDNHDNNFGNIYRAFFKKIDASNFKFYREKISITESVEIYESIIKKNVPSKNNIPKFDLILLGMGSDGHTASLFPYTEALKENQKIVVFNRVNNLDTERLTFTYPLILNADEIIILIKGEEKNKILNQILSKNNAECYPIAKIIRKHSKINIIKTQNEN